MKFLVIFFIIISSSYSLDFQALETKKVKQHSYQMDASDAELKNDVAYQKIVHEQRKIIAKFLPSSSAKKPSSYCFAGGLSNGEKNMCIALSTHNSSMCHAGGLSEGEKNICVAITTNNKSLCYATYVSEEEKNLCIATITKNQSFCFAREMSEREKNMCLASATHNKIYCYTSALSDSDRNMCLGTLGL